MKGFYLGQKGNYIEKTTIESLDISLLAKGDGTEITLQQIKADKFFYLYPSDDHETLEFFYIIEGICEYDEDNKQIQLVSGDYFYTQGLENSLFLKAITDLKLLWVSSRPAFHFVSESMNELIKVVKQVEEKDSYTYHHSIRVQGYSIKIAKELNLSTEEINNIYFASLFHDIGKIDIDRYILTKPGKLTDEEFAEIKRHPQAGYNMVKSTYYDEIADIILQHHERLNGSGYPNGLKADEILLEAKIIAVADTYDAMTSDRPYRKGLCPKIALEELKNNSRDQYDQEIVAAFERALNKKGKRTD